VIHMRQVSKDRFDTSSVGDVGDRSVRATEQASSCFQLRRISPDQGYFRAPRFRRHCRRQSDPRARTQYNYVRAHKRLVVCGFHSSFDE